LLLYISLSLLWNSWRRGSRSLSIRWDGGHFGYHRTQGQLIILHRGCRVWELGAADERSCHRCANHVLYLKNGRVSAAGQGMRRSVRDLAVSVLRLAGACPVICGLLATVIMGQSVPEIKKAAESLNPNPISDYPTAPGTGVLVLKVFRENATTLLDRQALIKLVNVTNQTTTWQTTEDHSQASLPNLPYGKYQVEVEAVGYLSAEKEVLVDKSEPVHIDIVLRRDPAASESETAGRIVSPNARKSMKRARSELVKDEPDMKRAQKYLDGAYKSAPLSPELNYMMGYLNFRKKDYEQGAQYLETATRLNPTFVQALMLLGRARLLQNNYPEAQSALEQAVAAEGENWLAHYLLADAYLQQKSYSQARDEAQIAIDQKKGEATLAQIVLGQALIGLGSEEQGIKALSAVLKASSRYFMAAEHVKDLIKEVRAREGGAASVEYAAVLERDSMEALDRPRLSVASWLPPGIDDTRVAVAPGVPGASERVIEEAGKQVVELVDDVARFAAVEDMFHQGVDEFGNPGNFETRKYNYVASISEEPPGFLVVDEYRSDKIDNRQGSPDGIVTSGFAALALVFHPHMRGNFDMQCEGLGNWHGQPTWIVHFRQRDDQPSRIHSYKVNGSVYPVSLKGRAWITATTFRILRIESEMVRPIPEIHLLSEHQIVEYGPVRFEKKNTSLWLPKTAEIYFDFQRHRYYRRHSFDHYMLFSVDSEEKRKAPVPPSEEKLRVPEDKKPR